MDNTLSTHQVAQMAQIHRDTLLRWLREGRIPEPNRNRNGWRTFTPDEAQAIVRYAQGEPQPNAAAHQVALREISSVYIASPISKLQQLDWNFADAQTGYLTHSLHPYPAKFIPQIPNALIQELSSVGDTVLDPFCGSGTTLVEALLLKRHAIGVDANPLACLIARAKTTRLEETDIGSLHQLMGQTNALFEQRRSGTLPLFPNETIAGIVGQHPNFDGLDFWFDPDVISELSTLKALCLAARSEPARQMALATFSSIVVAVSRQDSDTRYVRRDKSIKPGEVLQRFSRALDSAITRAIELTDLIEPRFKCKIVHADTLDGPNVGPVDLVVCSPPYPNAYSYHLYHRSRMLWLDMDQPSFKKVEIGSHRKYSKKGNGAANASTFRAELYQILSWLARHLKPGGYACFVIGDSTLKGELVHNDQLLSEAATESGYKLEANLTRRLQDSKKSFNPIIGKVKDEHIVILRNLGGPDA